MAKWPKGITSSPFGVLLLVGICVSTNESTEYSLTYLANQPNPTLSLYVSTPGNWSVPFNITAPGKGFSANRVVRYGEVDKITFQASDYILSNSSQRKNAITVRAKSDGRLSVYGGNLHTQSSDSFLVLPKQQEVWKSYKYIAASYFSAYFQHDSFTGIIAQYNNTQISITSKIDTTIGDILTLSGATTNISLQEGETFLVRSRDDLTGLLVVSNRPLAMLSGHECTNVPVSVRGCDHLVEQIPPVSSWGRMFATAPLKGRQAYDVFRILASDNLTMVVVNCTLSTDQPVMSNAAGTYMLDEGTFVEFRVSSSQYCLIEGSYNILVLQYSAGHNADNKIGDPTMIIVPAVSQYCNDYSLPTIQPGDKSFTFTHYMNIFIPAQYYQPDQIFLDDQLLSSYILNFTAIAQDGVPQVYAAQMELTEGVHTLYHADAEAMLGVIMYGFASANSYGHPGGLNLAQAESCYCRASNGHLVNLCIGTSMASSPCDCNDFGTCKCLDPDVYDADSGLCSLDTDGDSIPDYKDDCPNIFGTQNSSGCPTPTKTAVLCPVEEDTVWRIQWSPATPGSTQSARCPGEGGKTGLGLARRSCLEGGVWGSVDASNCESVAIRDIRIQTSILGSDLSVTRRHDLPVLQQERSAVMNISINLRNALNQSVFAKENQSLSVLPQDLKTSAKFLTLIAELSEDNELLKNDMENDDTEQQEEVVIDIVSSLLQDKNEPAFAATAKLKGTSLNEDTASPAVQILESTEKVANAITLSLSTESDDPSVALYRPNIAVHGQTLSFNELHAEGGIQFPSAGAMLPHFSRPALVPKVELPAAFLFAARAREYSMGVNGTEKHAEMTGLVNTVWNNIENYLPDTVIDEATEEESLSEEIPVKPQTLPASLVVSSQIPGYSGGEVNANATVDITFPIKDEIRNISVPSGGIKQFRCAFFNFTGGANRTGGWSYRGVKTEVINDTHVRCDASHLTSFVVLVSIVKTEDTSVDPLSYITYIGCSISLLCLLACIVFYISLRKELIQKLHNFVHFNLCIALSLGLLLFLTGIETATGNIIACKVVTALLHYFFLATFSWTLCEAVIIYILLVKVFEANDRKWIYITLVLGWALPIPIVVISAASRHQYYLIRHSFDENNTHYNQIKACWLPSEKGMIFAFVGPMIGILLVDAVLLTISLVSMAKTKCRSLKMEDSCKDEKTRYMKVGKSLLKTTIILLPVMGFTWIIGLFAVGEEGRVFAYLFVIANVFQGLFIFLFHVVRHEKVYGKIKKKLPCLKVFRAEQTGSGATSGTGPLPHSTHKPKDLNNSKVICSTVDIEAVATNSTSFSEAGVDVNGSLASLTAY